MASISAGSGLPTGIGLKSRFMSNGSPGGNSGNVTLQGDIGGYGYATPDTSIEFNDGELREPEKYPYWK